MANEKTAVDLLNSCNKQYRFLRRRYGSQTQCAKEALEKLIDMLIVEIYFDKHIKSLLPSDEMAGFIMDIKPTLPNLINNYNLNSSASFNTYMRRTIEIKAFTYSRNYMKKERIKESYLLNYYPYSSDYLDLFGKDPYEIVAERYDIGKNKNTYFAYELKSICARRKITQKKLFVYFCSLLPYLSSDVIDYFCSILNCNSKQTYALADYLYETKDINRCRRLKSDYLQERQGYHWMRTVELETLLYNLGFVNKKEELMDKIAKEKNYHHNFVEKIKTKKNKVPQAVLCEILNLNVDYVNTSIYNSKRLITQTYDKVSQKDYKPDYPKKAPKEFLPFKEFNIKLIPC